MNSSGKTTRPTSQSIISTDLEFPSCFKLVKEPISQLYYLGDISLLHHKKRVAIVGTRNPSLHGIEEGEYLTRWFVERGFLVISGLAVGCDTIAHQTCLDIGGKTIAILPCGIGKIYPKVNVELALNIFHSGGLLLSEYSDLTFPRPYYFVKRDRIQSALSQAVIVIQSEMISGTMKTARYAIQHKRILGCVDYGDSLNIPQIEGNRHLIQPGLAFPINRDNLLDFERKILEFPNQ